MSDMFTFAKQMTWALATLPFKMVFGSGNHMHSSVLRKINPMVVITGCDSGIGMLTAIQMQNNGFEVVATCETEEGVARIKDKVNTAMKMDILKDRDIDTVFRRTNELLSRDSRARLWALINNAGTNIAAPIDWLEFSDFRRISEVNYLGAVHMTKVFLPLLKQTCGSRVINICGFGTSGGPPSMGAYTPSKCALDAFSEELAIEMKQFGVYVVAMELPMLRTPMMEQIEDAARGYYDHLPPEMKRQYPRQDVEKYFKSLGSCMRGAAADPIRAVRMMMRALRAQEPQFKYTEPRLFIWKWLDAMLPTEVKQDMYVYRSGALPKAIAPAMPLPTAAA